MSGRCEPEEHDESCVAGRSRLSRRGELPLPTAQRAGWSQGRKGAGWRQQMQNRRKRHGRRDERSCQLSGRESINDTDSALGVQLDLTRRARATRDCCRSRTGAPFLILLASTSLACSCPLDVHHNLFSCPALAPSTTPASTVIAAPIRLVPIDLFAPSAAAARAATTLQGLLWRARLLRVFVFFGPSSCTRPLPHSSSTTTGTPINSALERAPLPTDLPLLAATRTLHHSPGDCPHHPDTQVPLPIRPPASFPSTALCCT